MKLYNIPALVFLLLTVACSPTSYIEKDPTFAREKYQTYAWVDTRMAQDETGASPTEFAKLSVQNAVNSQLQNKGLTQNNTDPDLLLSYDLLVERDVERRNNPVYTQPLVRYYYNPFFRRWGSIYYPTRFLGYDSYSVPVQEATLTITMMDTKSDKKIWQGWSTQTISGGRPTPDEVRSKVNAILKKF